MPGKGRTPGFFLKSYSLISFFLHIRWPIQKVFLLTTRTKILSQIKNLGDKVNFWVINMEGLHDNFTAPNPPTEVARRSVVGNNNMDPSFISLSFITDDDILEEFNTVNETIMDDYSQASTAALSNSQEPDVSQM